MSHAHPAPVIRPRRALPGVLLAVVLVGAPSGRGPGMAWAQPGPTPSAAPPASAPDWPSLPGGPAHLGVASIGPRPPLEVAWSTASPVGGAVAGVALAGDLAVVAGPRAVAALDPGTGRVLWADVGRSGPPVAPAVAPRAGSGGIAVYVEGSSPAALVGVDLSTRATRWRRPLDGSSRTPPAVAGGLAVVGTDRGTVEAVDVASGGLRWRARVGARVEAAPALAGSRVFAVGEDPRTGRTSLRALDAATGRVLWTYSPQGVSVGTSSPSVFGTRVFVGFGDRVVRALDAATGRVLWQQPVRAGFSPRSSPAVAPRAVYVADVDGGLYRFDPVSGDRRWDFQFPAGVGLSAPLVVDGAVYVGLADGTVAAVASDTGHLVWRNRTRLGGVGPLTPAGRLLLAPGSTGPGGVVAFRHRPSGALLDQRSPTEVRLLQALLNFAVAAVALLGVLLGASGVVRRRWRPSDRGSSRSAAHLAAGEPRE